MSIDVLHARYLRSTVIMAVFQESSIRMLHVKRIMVVSDKNSYRNERKLQKHQIITCVWIESFSFKLRMLHDTGMIHSRYIHDAF